ncbi:helix-turn-helix domain-containing protein [Parapedobacter koreensis]|nr:AraC family transcriptional regulator [Parapedobacter koreensis]
MKQFLIAITCLFTVTYLFSQSPEEDFNRAFMHIYMHTASEDINVALEAADSLYRVAGSDIQKIRSLMLISDMFHRMSNRDSSIHYAIKAERIAERTTNHAWQARICGVLSTQHRETGLFSAGKQYVEKGLRAIEKVDNPEVVNQFKGQCFQELGFYALAEKQYHEAIAHFKRADLFFINLADSTIRHFALAQNDERLGLCHMELGAIDSAKFYYERALVLERRASEAETPMKGFIYDGLGRVHLAKQQYGLADSCFQRALAIAEASGFPNLKISVYKNLAHYHQLTGNEEGYHQYNEKYLREIGDDAARHRKYADNILARIQQKVLELSATNRMLGIAAAAFIVLAGLSMGMYIRRQRKNQRRYKDVISRLRSARTQALAVVPATVETSSDRDKDLMPESTKQELLRKLEHFESSQQFTERNISIAVLAGKMKTNTKYLSYIINNYRNKDFNSYINELRINYIISKIGADNRYLNYKISYLAEECGFATHSQFTTVFRNITGLSPSTFLTYLKKDEQVGDNTMVN